MNNITKHHSKLQWESNYCENCRVDFFIIRDSISVYDFLESISEFVCLEIGGFQKTLDISMDLFDLRRVNLSVLPHLLHFLRKLFFKHWRTPHKSNQNFISLFQMIQLKVYGLFLNDKPFVDVEKWVFTVLYFIDLYQVRP